MQKKHILVPMIALFLCLLSAPAFANKTSAAIDAPDSVKKGDVVKIKITVKHRGNNFIHHTDWAYVNVNGKEAGRWEYSFHNLPEGEVFSKEVAYTVDGPFTIEAEGDCNIHGSEGKVTKNVKVE
jgi:desulfoferrodoxin (superoxide reductase-like protein)